MSDAHRPPPADPDWDLAAKAVTADLFGEDGLLEPAEVSCPEKYELGWCLGRGGFGVVYQARDRSLDRPVALKFLTHARPAEVERFRREARFAARLDDPAIVKVYELGEHEGQCYIAMEWVDGPNLADAQLGRRELVRAVREVARALEHAHLAGIVHRDIKPENVLVDRQGRAHLTDFGIARDLGAEGTVTLEGLVIGTPQLMPPEQAEGRLRAVDARSDVYALGATLYTLLCGRRPFAGRGLVATLHAVIHDPPELPRALDPTIPRELEAITLRCLHKTPGDRYASMRELGADLDRWLEGAPVEGAGNPWFRRLVGAPPAPPAPPETDPLLGLGLEVAAELAAWDADLYRISRDLPRTFPRLEALLTRLDGALAQRPDLGWARFQRGRALLRLGRVDEALEEMERSIDRVADQAEAHFELGRVYLRLGLDELEAGHRHLSHVGAEFHHEALHDRLAQATLAFQEASRRKAALAPWQLEYVEAIRRLAARDFPGCVAACDVLVARDPDVEDVWRLRGDALRLAGEDPQESYERAIEVRRSDTDALLGLAQAHLERGDPAAARRAADRALAVHPGLLPALVLCARTALLEGGEAALLPALERLEEARRQAPEEYEVAIALAELECELGRRQGREDRLEHALQCLSAADELDGCMNRVSYLGARVHLERARLKRAQGRDPRPDLEEVLSHRGGPHVEVEDADPWRRLLEEAESELRAL